MITTVSKYTFQNETIFFFVFPLIFLQKIKFFDRPLIEVKFETGITKSGRSVVDWRWQLYGGAYMSLTINSEGTLCTGRYSGGGCCIEVTVIRDCIVDELPYIKVYLKIEHLEIYYDKIFCVY